MCDWTTCDISGISEADFPVRCDPCEQDLTGLGDVGRCPRCDCPFERRERLWTTYGPEAFAGVSPEESGRNSAWLTALLHSGIIAAGFLITALILGVLFEAAKIGTFIAVWLLIVLLAEFFWPRSGAPGKPGVKPPTEDDSDRPNGFSSM
jgi:hypothetical protein